MNTARSLSSFVHVRVVLHGLASLCIAGALTACGGGGGASRAVDPGSGLSATATLGQKIFADRTLSASGQQACASCHDAAHGLGAPNNLPAQLGGLNLDIQGVRNAPSIRYLVTNKAFRIESDGTPTGGFFWDGRASSLADQAGEPFLNGREMANASKADVISKLALASYAGDFRRVFGNDIFNDPDAAFERVKLALQAYEKEDPDFAPFSSKYDAFLRGKAQLTAAEQRGLALFNSPTKGNCAACHPSAISSDGSFPLFTDFSFDSLGVPRNWSLLANSDPSYHDLGLCNSTNAVVSAMNGTQKAALCGLFKVPSLRNVAVRQAYFHNGRFTDLKEAITFYVQRDTNPEKWYLDANGQVDAKFNDTPAAYLGNINTVEVPYNRHPGDQPALTDAEIDDVVSFLKTLTDGWTP